METQRWRIYTFSFINIQRRKEKAQRQNVGWVTDSEAETQLDGEKQRVSFQRVSQSDE